MKKTNEVKEIRAMTGLSQARFADKYGIPKRTLEDWEADRRVPPAYVVNLLRRCVEADNEKKAEE